MMRKIMNILVIAPMKVEADNFRAALNSIPHRHSYRISNVGVGKANAAAGTALELYGNISAPNYDLIAVIGYAGGSSRLTQGEFVIPRVACYHDVNCPEGIVPELTAEYPLQGSDNIGVLTGDSFVTKDNYVTVNTKTPNRCESVIYDMEVAAVCQIAALGEVPVIVLKLISDIPSKDNNLQSFNDFVETHSNFSQFVHYLEGIE